MDDQSDDLKVLADRLRPQPNVCEVLTAQTKSQAMLALDGLIKRSEKTVLFLDVLLWAGKPDTSLKLLDWLRQTAALESGLVEVVITTATAPPEEIRPFKKLGFERYIDKLAVTKGATTGVSLLIQDSLDRMRQRAECRYEIVAGSLEASQMATRLQLPEELIPAGSSPTLWEVYDNTRTRVLNDRNLKVRPIYLVCGDTGTGKEWLAKAIHHWAGRPGDFHGINMRSLAEASTAGTQVGQAKLFGYDSSFRHSPIDLEGMVDAARDGTLLFDDFQDMHPETKSWLLRFFDDGREYTRVGGGKRFKSNAQIVITTNRPMEQLVREGIVDLQTKMRIFKYGDPIYLPNIGERGIDDVIAWTKRFANKYFSDRFSRQCGLSLEVEALIRSVSIAKFRGNIRDIEGLANTACSRLRYDPNSSIELVLSADAFQAALANWDVLPDENSSMKTAWSILGFTELEGRRYQAYLDRWTDLNFREQVEQTWHKQWIDSESRRSKQRTYQPFQFSLNNRNDYLATVEALIRGKGVVKKAAEEYGRARSNFYRNVNLYHLPLEEFRI
jgi:DNA-binding NtrC family response regulator